MEAAAFWQSPHLLSKTAELAPRPRVLVYHSSLDCRSLRSDGFLKRWSSVSRIKQRERASILSRGVMRSLIRASANFPSGPSESSSHIAPLRLESPVGQFLSQILLSHPYLLPAAVDQQLEQLLMDLEVEKNQEEPSSTGTDLILYQRIAELKVKERKKALEEILYALVVQKFVEADLSMVPAITQSPDDPDKVGHWPSWEDKFQKLHSSEAYEMIKNHLSVILGNRLDDSSSIASISKLRAGQVYAASILYGYFLKRVDQRFQLEKTMKTLSHGSEEERQWSNEASMPPASDSAPSHHDVTSFSPNGFADRIKPCRLRTYVMSLDSDTLQRFASVRSKEALGIIEKQMEALFGRPEVAIAPQGTIDSSKDEIIRMSFAGLKRLVLEAVTFGSFLWDVESYVDSRFHFVAY